MSDDFYETGGIGEQVPDIRDAEIASLRATIERLTRERDEAHKCIEQIERAKMHAEATIARLAEVVKRAHEYRNECQAGVGCDCAVGQGLDASLSSLTPEDRRRAGIEG